MEGIEGAVRRANQDLQAAQNRMAQRVNAHRRELEFNPGDLVLLSTKNLRQPGPGVKKLKPSHMGPLLTCDDMIREYKAKNGLAEKAIDMVNA